MLSFQGLHESTNNHPKNGQLITPTPSSHYYSSPLASKCLNKTTILQGISQSVKNTIHKRHRKKRIGQEY